MRGPRELLGGFGGVAQIASDLSMS
jgi:hypothetical protein